MGAEAPDAVFLGGDLLPSGSGYGYGGETGHGDFVHDVLIPALAPVGRLAWPWYVPLGTAATVAVAFASASVRTRRVA